MVKKALRFTQDETAAAIEVDRLGGRIVHKFSPTAFVAELPETADLTALTESAAEPTQPLDTVTHLMVDAWLSTRQARGDEAPPPGEGLPWDAPGFQPPLEFGTPAANALAIADEEEVAESTGTPTSRYLIGSVAVGLVLVSRDTGPEVMTEAERTKIVQEVQ